MSPSGYEEKEEINGYIKGEGRNAVFSLHAINYLSPQLTLTTQRLSVRVLNEITQKPQNPQP
jgi:hypothetical protein